jgi:hypothetical protein
MSDDEDLPTTRVALYCYRRSPQRFLEFLIHRQPEGDHAIWLAYEEDVPAGMNAVDVARQAAERLGSGDVMAIGYHYPVPLWGSLEARFLAQESGSEEVYCAEALPDAGESLFADAMHWVTVMDGVAQLRYPEHVEALLRVAALAESAIRQRT